MPVPALAPPREFWIDVGGTFTDCIARLPDGTLRVRKILSSGAVLGRAAQGSTRAAVLDPARRADPPRFFEGWTLRVGGEEVPVESFDAATGRIAPGRALRADPAPGASYELLCAEEAPVTGIRWLMGIGLHDPVGKAKIRLGTTRGTNALLEKTGAATAFVTTRGFADVLLIANQDRPRLFDLNIRKPRPLFRRAVEVDERIASDGSVLEPLDEPAARASLEAVRTLGIEAVAICLLNAYLNPAHEEAVARIAGELGFRQVSVSSRLSPLQKIVSRGDTTVVDAYLSPVIRDYVRALRRCAPEADLKLMSSAGALADAEAFVGKDSVLSGPAGGVVGVSRAAEAAGIGKAIGFDMGGTSTDVCRFEGEFERRYEMEVNDPESGAGVRIVAPMLWIETVAAGGGSVCGFDGQKPVVGPRSAGADPGPACYGRGGPLAITDVNLVLGRIAPDLFPFPLDEAAALRALDAVADEIAAATGVRYRREQLAEGFVRIANANMAAPIRKISVRKGIDAREYALVCFGGAGGQHACAVARILGITRVLVPRLDGALSAFGIGTADVRRFGDRHVGKPLTAKSLAEIEPAFLELEDRLRREVLAEGIREGSVLPPRRRLDLRYKGQSVALTVDAPPEGAWRKAFEEAHRRHYGFVHALRGVEIHALRAEVAGGGEVPESPPIPPREGPPRPLREGTLWTGGRRAAAPVFRRDDLAPGDRIAGPALILGSIGTTVVDSGFRASVLEAGDLLLEDLHASAGALPSSPLLPFTPSNAEPAAQGGSKPALTLPSPEGRGSALPPLPPGEGRGEGGEAPARRGEGEKGRRGEDGGPSARTGDKAMGRQGEDRGTPSSARAGSPDPSMPVDQENQSAAKRHQEDQGPGCDPITLEIFNNQFASIAEQMGVVLQKTALSTNVKERLDFSCALFDESGELVVNAPHIPVHLGGMSDGVKALLEDVPVMRPGDVFITNDPYRGGSHLPDVTVVSPVFEIPNPKSQIPTKSQISNLKSEISGPKDGSPRLLFFTASRAHHAEIGGISPGSMPPFSRTLGEEGVLIRRFRLVEGSRSSEEELESLLASGPHPSRAPAENIADINAQVAANRLGARLLLEMAAKYGRGTVRAYMGHIRAAAARAMREALAKFAPGEYRFEDRLDDGTPLRVLISIRHDRGRDWTGLRPGQSRLPACAQAVVDFTGTGPVLEGNLNANASIVSSTVLYCLRCLIPGDIPLNGGVLEPVRIVLPECFLNPPAAPDGASSPAVAGGNVETSQRIADAVFGALRVVAAGQGTMNNLIFGNERFQYYETIAGGSGAGPGFDGADGVHVHMTNTRITDPEVLEARCPVRLRRFEIRRGSGGSGRHRGGDGVVREIEFLEPVEVSLLTQRRLVAPYGVDGGGDGQPGRNRFLPADAPEIELPPIGAVKADAGDVLVIETPGGGGWGHGATGSAGPAGPGGERGKGGRGARIER